MNISGLLVILMILLIIKWLLVGCECKHKWIITNTSNTLQLDDMGYPLRLCIVKCRKCGKIEQQWIDVNTEVLSGLNTGRFVEVKWGFEND